MNTKLLYLVSILFCISTCFAADIYLNTETDCSPLVGGCLFESPSTWVGEVLPAVNDSVYIITNKTASETLIHINNVHAPEGFRLHVLVLENVTAAFDNSTLFLGFLTIVLSDVNIHNTTHLPTDTIHVVDSRVRLFDGSTLSAWNASTFTNSTLSTHEQAIARIHNTAFHYGALHTFDTSEVDLRGTSTLFGVSLFTNSSTPVKFELTSFRGQGQGQHTYHLETGLVATTVFLGLDVILNVTGTVSITDSITLGENSELVLDNLRDSNSIAHVSAVGRATILITAEAVQGLWIGTEQLSNLSNVAFVLQGRSRVFFNHVELGEVITEDKGVDLANSHIFANSSLYFTRNLTLQGGLSLLTHGHVIVHHDISLNFTNCISNSGVLYLYGHLECSEREFVTDPAANTFLHGEIISPRGALFGGNVTLAGATILSPNSQIRQNLENATLRISGKNYIDGSVSLWRAHIYVSSVEDTLGFKSYGLDSIWDTVSIVVHISRHVKQNPDDFIFEALDYLSLQQDVKLTVVTTEDDAPTEETTYNLLRVVNGTLRGNFTEEVILQDPSSHAGHVALTRRPNEIVFLYAPPPANEPGGLPIWAWVLIAIGAALVIVLGVYFAYRTYKRRKVYEPVSNR
jgi:hypothetical protein